MNQHSLILPDSPVDPYSTVFPSTPDHRCLVDDLRDQAVRQYALREKFGDSRRLWFWCRSIPDEASVAAAIAFRPDSEPLITRWRDVFWSSFPPGTFDGFKSEIAAREDHLFKLAIQADSAGRHGKFGVRAKVQAEHQALSSPARDTALHIIDDAHSFLTAINGPAEDTYIAMGGKWYRFDGACFDGGYDFFQIAPQDQKLFPEINRATVRRRLVDTYWAIGPYMAASKRLHFVADDGPTAAAILLGMSRNGHTKAFVKGQKTKSGTWIVGLEGLASETEAMARLVEVMHPNPFVANAMEHPIVIQEFLPFTHEQRFFVQGGRIVGSACSDRNLCVLDATGRRFDDRVAVLKQPAEHPGEYDRGITSNVVDRAMAAAFVRVGRKFARQMKAVGYFDYTFDVGMTERGAVVVETNDALWSGPYCLDRSLELETARYHRRLADKAKVRVAIADEGRAPPFWVGSGRSVVKSCAGIDMSIKAAFAPELYRHEIVRPDPQSLDDQVVYGELHCLVRLPVAVLDGACDACLYIGYDAAANELVGVQSDVVNRQGERVALATRYRYGDRGSVGLGGLFLHMPDNLYEDGHGGLVRLTTVNGVIAVIVVDPDDRLVIEFPVDWLPEAVGRRLRTHLVDLRNVDTSIRLDPMAEAPGPLVPNESVAEFRARLLGAFSEDGPERSIAAEQTAFGAASMILFALAKCRMPDLPSTVVIRRPPFEIMTLTMEGHGVITSSHVWHENGSKVWDEEGGVLPAQAVLSGLMSAMGLPLHHSMSAVARALVDLTPELAGSPTALSDLLRRLAHTLPDHVMIAAHSAAALLFADAPPIKRELYSRAWHTALTDLGFDIDGDLTSKPPLLAAMEANAGGVALDLLLNGATPNIVFEGRNAMDAVVASLVGAELTERREHASVSIEHLRNYGLPKILGDGASPVLRFVNAAIDDPARLLKQFARRDVARPDMAAVVGMLMKYCGLEKDGAYDLAIERLQRITASNDMDAGQLRLLDRDDTPKREMVAELQGVWRELLQ